MSTPDYPSNRMRDKEQAAPPPPPVDKDIKRVTTNEPKRRKRSLKKQFKNVFFNGDPKSVATHVLFGVLVPAAQDMVIDAVESGVERIVKGESRRSRRGAQQPQSGPTGYVSYNRYSMGGQQQQPRYMSYRGRSMHNFDEIVLTSRAEAEEVIERMFDILNRYDSVSVSDFYELVGAASTSTDHKWGWRDLRGAGVSRVRNGYLLDLPDPEVIDI